MPELSFPLLTGAVALPLAGAAAAYFQEARARAAAVAASGASAVCAALVLREVQAAPGARLADPWLPALFAADALNATFLLLYSLLTLGIVILAPRRDTGARITGVTLLMLAATMATYAADNLIVLAAGWTLTALPFIAGPFAGAWRPRAGLAVSCAALLGAVAIIAGPTQSFDLSALQGHNYGGSAAFALLILAITCRKGIFPAHAWIEDLVESGPALPVSLFINGHFGAFLLARVVIPEYPLATRGAFPILADLALFTALYAAVRAVTERRARRVLALLALSQSACILAGLESATPEGISGALIHCVVVATATTGLFSVLRLMEVRFHRSFTIDEALGLAEHTPRMAVFFVVCGLALVGLPGTMGFCSEDLLIYGTLESHPQVGLLLPLATALNAVSLFRLFSKIFLGKQRTGVHGVGDALPRERWVLTAIAAAIVIAGFAPGVVVKLRSGAVRDLQSMTAPASLPSHPPLQSGREPL